MIGLVVVVFFFMFRSQKKQEKEANEMRNNLQIGDEITTIGGIIGEIVRIKDETVTIETGKDRTKIRILRTAIRTVDVHAADKYGTAPAKPQEDKSPIKVEKVKVSKKNKKEAAEVVEAAAPEATTEENK
jgi:preprotein translocase subunit YajC